MPSRYVEFLEQDQSVPCGVQRHARIETPRAHPNIAKAQSHDEMTWEDKRREVQHAKQGRLNDAVSATRSAPLRGTRRLRGLNDAFGSQLGQLGVAVTKHTPEDFFIMGAERRPWPLHLARRRRQLREHIGHP